MKRKLYIKLLKTEIAWILVGSRKTCDEFVYFWIISQLTKFSLFSQFI